MWRSCVWLSVVSALAILGGIARSDNPLLQGPTSLPPHVPPPGTTLEQRRDANVPQRMPAAPTPARPSAPPTSVPETIHVPIPYVPDLPMIQQAQAQESQPADLALPAQKLSADYVSPYPLYDVVGKVAPGLLPGVDATGAPTYPSVKLTGFFQADSAWFAQDKNSLKTFSNIQDDRGFRRARLAAIGDVAPNVSYMLEMDFAFPGRPSFMDVFLDIHKLPILGNFRVGQYRIAFGMDELTSARELQFLERGITFGLAPFRQMAVGFHDTNDAKTITWAFDGFGYPTDFFGNSTGDRGYGIASRLTGLPYYDEENNRLIHIGADYNCLETSTGHFDFHNQPEYGGQFGPLNVGNTAITNVPFFIDTGIVPATTTQMLNGELAVAYGSFYAQSEVRYAFINLEKGYYITLPTMYAQCGYFLTGEKRPYNKTGAVFGRVKPLYNFGCGGMGALEIAFRFSYANFHNNVNPTTGNELTDTTCGINWYLNPFTKFQLNWIHSMVSSGTGLSSNTDIFAVRAQLDF